MAKKSTKSVRSKPSKKSKKTSQKPTKATKRSRKQTQSAKTKTPVVKTQKARKFNSPYPHADANVFREGSSYAIAFDILAAHPDGLPRQELIAKHAKATGKSQKLSGFDCSVLLSAKTSPTGERHQSCREGFWIEKINDHVRLRTK